MSKVMSAAEAVARIPDNVNLATGGFVGTFSTGSQDIRIEDGELRIVKDGDVRKFVREVEHRTFAGRLAAEAGKPKLYVTERCVFRLTSEGLELLEIAPGVELERDILQRMDFRPIVREPKLMDARLFRAARIGLRGLIQPCLSFVRENAASS